MTQKFRIPPIITYLVGRVGAGCITLIITTALIHAIVMMVPVEARAALYLPDVYKPKTDEQIQQRLTVIVREHGLDDPYPIQYSRWLIQLLKGDWGWSPNLQQDVLEALLARTPSTVELALASIMVYLPLGLLSGAYAGWKKESPLDRYFRLLSFVGVSVPPFILGLVLLSIFYAGLRWFLPGEISPLIGMEIRSESFRTYTGLITLDGLLNQRFDVFLDGLRHLILPATSLGVGYWATLGLITRSSMIEELGKDYVLRAKSIGLSNNYIIWRHAFRNAMLPGLTSSALSAASLLTGVYVVEIVFNRRGASELIAYTLLNVRASQVETPLPAGFAVYSILAVLLLMLFLDILQALGDPRIQIEEK